MKNIYTFNWHFIPRVYPIIFFFKILRARGITKLFEELLRKTSISQPVRRIIIQMFYLVFLMHLCACFFYIGGLFNLKDKNNNWMSADGLIAFDDSGTGNVRERFVQTKDSTSLKKYFSALYFSVVTCTTVGYGDIVPKNDFELFLVMAVMLVGVVVFSYTLGDLAGQFGEITRSNKATEARNMQISDLDS